MLMRPDEALAKLELADRDFAADERMNLHCESVRLYARALLSNRPAGLLDDARALLRRVEVFTVEQENYSAVRDALIGLTFAFIALGEFESGLRACQMHAEAGLRPCAESWNAYHRARCLRGTGDAEGAQRALREAAYGGPEIYWTRLAQRELAELEGTPERI